MSQSQIASTRSATAAEGRMLLEKPSGTTCSPPHLGGCNSGCESPIRCPDTTRKAPSCGKSRRKPSKPSATPHSALRGHLEVVRGFSTSPLLPLKHFATRQRNSVASDARLSQQILLDFAHWRSGQSLEEVDLAWYLEFGQPTDQIFANIIRVQNMTDLRHDRSDDRLTPIAVRDTIDGNLGDRRMP